LQAQPTFVKLQGQGKMIGSQKRRWPSLVLALAIFFLSWIIRSTHAEELGPQSKPEEGQAVEEPGLQTKPKEAPAAEEPGHQAKPKEAEAKGATAGGAAAPGQGFDQAVVSAGMAAFERSCTKCHDASRSLERTKDLAGWRATVRRMAAKRGADVASGDMEPIAVYLASRNAAASGTPAEKDKAAASGTPAEKDKAAASGPSNDTSALSTFATLSPQWRGGNNHLQNSGFGPLAWVGASWQGKIVSVRATLCISCHGVQEPSLISRVEPVEVAVHVDLSEYLDPCVHGMKGGIDAGRIVVPFGAFSAQADPSLYRTVSTPLIFNMGQRLFNQDLGFPVLPMPYADEGVNLNLAVPLGDCGTGPITATLDGYLVNGLEGSSNGLDFLQSRDLFDNNDRVASGGRLTLGDPYIRAGASYTTGRFDDPNASGVPGGLKYRIYGFDVQARYKRLFRCQFEYARRDSDRSGILATGTGVFSEAVAGYYLEAEARPWDKCRVSLLARYDSQSRISQLPPSGSTLPLGTFNVERITVGINIELWRQSLLMINFERWLLPELAHHTTDIFGVRYTITF
jgi:hypothetical protein